MGLFWASIPVAGMASKVRMQDNFLTFVEETQNTAYFVEYLPTENEQKYKLNIFEQDVFEYSQ